jgi:Sigma-70, region 4/SnoaL-like domain
MIERRPTRVMPIDHGGASDPHEPPARPLLEPVWLEPYPDQALEVEDASASPETRYERRESIELAFIAALQHLPSRQRAVLLLRDVLGLAPAEIAAALDTTPAAIYSLLQRARQAADERLPARSQQATLRTIGDRRLRDLVERYLQAWDQADAAAITEMLADDATLSMPPRPNWYQGRAAVRAFLATVPLSGRRRWHHLPTRGQRPTLPRRLPTRRARHRTRARDPGARTRHQRAHLRHHRLPHPRGVRSLRPPRRSPAVSGRSRRMTEDSVTRRVLPSLDRDLERLSRARAERARGREHQR